MIVVKVGSVDFNTDTETERIAIICAECHSKYWLDYDEELAMFTECWRCSTIINGDL